MGDKTAIQWTHRPGQQGATWNPVTGCIKISAGCRFCYAERVAEDLQRRGTAGYAEGFKPTLQPSRLDQPLRWQKPRSIFVCSMSDLMQDDVPDWYIAAVMLVIYATPRHTYQLLTKRPERFARFCADVWGEHREDPIGRLWQMLGPILQAQSEMGAMGWGQRFLRDIMLIFAERTAIYEEQRKLRAVAGCPEALLPLNIEAGTSVEDQRAADLRIPHLLEVPARVRFLSMEPLIGPVTLQGLPPGGSMLTDEYRQHLSIEGDKAYPSREPTGIHWIIIGGESGEHARRCEGDWIRAIRRAAWMAEVPVFIKQLGYRYSDPTMGTAGKGLKVPADVPRPSLRLKCKKGGNPAEWPKWIGPEEDVRALPPAPPTLPEEPEPPRQQSLL